MEIHTLLFFVICNTYIHDMFTLFVLFVNNISRSTPQATIFYLVYLWYTCVPYLFFCTYTFICGNKYQKVHALTPSPRPTLMSISKEQHNTVYVWANPLSGAPCNNNSRIYTDYTLTTSCCCHLLPIPLRLHTYCWHHTNHTLLLALQFFCRSILTYSGSFLSRLFVAFSSPLLLFFRCVLCQQF